MNLIFLGGLLCLAIDIRMKVRSEMTTFRYIMVMDRRECKPEDVVFNTSGLTIAGCSAYCLEYQGCIGVFRSLLYETCIGCQRYYSDVCELEETWTYNRAFYQNSSIPSSDYKTLDEEGSGDCDSTTEDNTNQSTISSVNKTTSDG